MTDKKRSPGGIAGALRLYLRRNYDKSRETADDQRVRYSGEDE